MAGEEVWADFYCTTIDGTSASTVTSSGCALQTELHQLKAVAAEKSSIYVPLELTNHGTTNFSVTVSNRAITGSETQTATIVVVQGVDRAIPVIDGCVAANEVFTLSLEPFTGTISPGLWNNQIILLVHGQVNGQNPLAQQRFACLKIDIFLISGRKYVLWVLI